MRARRITIMLALVAISALTLFLVSLLDGDAFAVTPDGQRLAAVPDTIPFYHEIISIGPDGTASVDLTVVVGKGGLGDLLLPFDFTAGDEFKVLSGPAVFGTDAAGRVVPTVERLGHRLLNLRCTAAGAAGDTVRVAARVPDWYVQDESRRPYGEFALGRRYINFSAFVLRDFRSSLLLPPGMIVHSIEDVVPSFDPKKNPNPPFAISRTAGRTRATLATDDLAPAGFVQLDLHMRPARRGPIPLVAGVIIALLYLVFFRDVLKPKERQ